MKLLTMADVARLAGVSSGTIRHLWRTGQMPRPLDFYDARVRWIDRTIYKWLETEGPPERGGLVTPPEMASLLGVSVKTVRRMIARGELPLPIRVGNQLRWRPDDLVDWLQDIPSGQRQ